MTLESVPPTDPPPRQLSLLPLLMPRVAPPADYYAENLSVMLRTIDAQYADLLDEAERTALDALLTLDRDALRLFARLISRRGPCIRVDTLLYLEVEDRDSALATLVERGLIEWCVAVPPTVLLAKLTRVEIERRFPNEPREGRKGQLIGRLVTRFAPVIVYHRVRLVSPWVTLAAAAIFDRFRILFFGDPHQDLTAFVMRDLGMVRYESVVVDRDNRLFADRETFDRYLELLDLNRDVARLGDGIHMQIPEADGVALIDRLWTEERHRTLERRRSRTLNRLGRALERSRHFDAALTAYGRSTLPPARERRTRVLDRLDDEIGVDALLARLRAAPLSAEERDFARRFRRRRSRRDVPIEDFVLSAPPETSIEQHALAELTADGGIGWHLENCLPMALFTLAYWEWIFAPIDGAFVNAFQSGPLDLFWPDFFAKRDHLPVPAAKDLAATILAKSAQKDGTANPLFHWQRWTDAAQTIVGAIGNADLERLIGIVRDDLQRARTGFPDLTVIYPSGRYEFVEVKGPGDQLQNNQLLWIAALQEHQLPVRVVRYTAADDGAVE